MDFRDLFNITTQQTVVRVATPPGAPAPAADTQEKSQNVFLTPQALITFPGATTAALLILRVLASLQPDWSKGPWPPFVISLVLGAFIWWIGISDPKAQMTARDKIVAAGIAILNTLQIYAAVRGLPLS